MYAEQVGIVVVVLAVASVFVCNSSITRIVLPLAIIGATGITGTIMRAQYTSARKAKAKKTPAAAPLPQTVNKRAKASSAPPPKTDESPPASRENAGEEAPSPPVLPQTKNPRRIEKSEPASTREVAAPPNPNSPWANSGSVNGFVYTPQAQQLRRDEFQFRPTVEYQTADARERVLNSLYKELLDTSEKRDPALRPVGVVDACEPMRGLTQPHTLP